MHAPQLDGFVLKSRLLNCLLYHIITTLWWSQAQIFTRSQARNTSFYVRQILWIKKNKFIELPIAWQVFKPLKDTSHCMLTNRYFSFPLQKPLGWRFFYVNVTSTFLETFFFFFKWNWINRLMLDWLDRISMIDIRFNHELELLSNDAFNQIDCIEVNSIRHWKPFKLTRTNDNLCLRSKHGNNNSNIDKLNILWPACLNM